MDKERITNKGLLSVLKNIRTLKNQLGVIEKLDLDEKQKAVINKAMDELFTTINQYH